MPGTTAFPTALDTSTFPDIDGAVDDMDAPPHDEQHNNAAAALLAIETKLGIDASGDVNSIDYRVQRLEGIVDAIITQLGPTPVLVTGAFDDPLEQGDTLTGALTIANGWSPYSVEVQSGTAPPGAAFGISGMTVVSTGTLTTQGAYSWTLRVHGADGSYDDSALSLTVNMSAVTVWNSADCDIAYSFSESDLRATWANSSWGTVRANTSRNAATANHYFEVEIVSLALYAMVGVCDSSAPLGASGYHTGASAYAYYALNGNKWNNSASAAYGSTYTASDVVGVLLKNGKVYFRLNGTWQNGADPVAETGAAYSGVTGMLFPALEFSSSGDSGRGKFTQASLLYALPAGSSAWDT